MKTRGRFTDDFNAKVALEAIQGQPAIAELATRQELHPNLITQWKRQAIEKLAKVFDDKEFAVQANRDEPAEAPQSGRIAGGGGSLRRSARTSVSARTSRPQIQGSTR